MGLGCVIGDLSRIGMCREMDQAKSDVTIGVKLATLACAG